MACYLLVSEIPDAGLSEAAEALLQMKEFYDSRLATPAKPAISNRVSLPLKIAETRIRPALTLEE